MLFNIVMRIINVYCFLLFKYSIEDDTAKKTLLAMIREKWSLGRYTYTDIEERHPGWLNARVEEFQVS